MPVENLDLGLVLVVAGFDSIVNHFFYPVFEDVDDFDLFVESSGDEGDEFGFHFDPGVVDVVDDAVKIRLVGVAFKLAVFFGEFFHHKHERLEEDFI